MADIVTIVRERQLAIRRELERRGISLKVVAQDSGLPYPTVISYFPGKRDCQPATIPGSAIYALANVLPLDLLSLLLPDDLVIVRAPDGIDHDEIAAACVEFVTGYTAARHAASERGIEIGPREAQGLSQTISRLRSVVS